MHTTTIFVGFMVSLGLVVLALAWKVEVGNANATVSAPYDLLPARQTPNLDKLANASNLSEGIPKPITPPTSPSPSTVVVNQNLQNLSTSAASIGPPYYYGGVAYPYQYPSVYFDEYYYRRPWERPAVYGPRDGRRSRRNRHHSRSQSRSPSPARRSRTNSPSVPRPRSSSPSARPASPIVDGSPSRSPYILKN
jgi:hypothetical protein